LSGCSAVLPTLSQCSTNPNQEGCPVVISKATECITTLGLSSSGCETVLPPTKPTTDTTVTIPTVENPVSPVKETVDLVVTTTVSAQALVTKAPVGSGTSSGGSGGGTQQTSSKPAEKSSSSSDKSDDKKDEKKTTSGPEDSGAKKNEPAKKMYCN
jgi:hypothetical protein